MSRRISVVMSRAVQIAQRDDWWLLDMVVLTDQVGSVRTWVAQVDSSDEDAQ
jgi:hypothetical protein